MCISSGNVCPNCGKPIWNDGKSTVVPDLCQCGGIETRTNIERKLDEIIEILKSWDES